MIIQKLQSSEEIQEARELLKKQAPGAFFDNYSNYSKPKACTEKSNCCLCPYRYSCNIEEAMFSEEDLKIINFRGNKMIKEAAEMKDYITKDELIERAKTLEINTASGSFNKLLADYKEAGLIEPSIMKSKASLGILGERGTVGFYKKNTPEVIHIIKLLLKEGFSLSEISEYRQMFIQGVISHISAYGLKDGLCDSDTEKYFRVLVYFFAIEAKINLTKHNLSKMSFNFEYRYPGPEHYPTDPPIDITINYMENGQKLAEFTYKPN